jgi:hypothetical protein
MGLDLGHENLKMRMEIPIWDGRFGIKFARAIIVPKTGRKRAKKIFFGMKLARANGVPKTGRKRYFLAWELRMQISFRHEIIFRDYSGNFPVKCLTAICR